MITRFCIGGEEFLVRIVDNGLLYMRTTYTYFKLFAVLYLTRKKSSESMLKSIILSSAVFLRNQGHGTQTHIKVLVGWVNSNKIKQLEVEQF